MAMAATDLCPDCDKQKGIVPCLGCKKVFCVKHFQTHRQNLSVELENVVTRRNTLQEYYFNNIAQMLDPKKLDAWSTIDEWEQGIQQQVKTIADEARKKLDEYSRESRNRIDYKLNQITETIQQKMERENFIEEDIANLTRQIDELEDGVQNNKYHPKVEVISQPIDWNASIQIKLSVENESKNPKETPSITSPSVTKSSNKADVSSKPKYSPSVQSECFECGRETWQKECKHCAHIYCGWHLKKHTCNPKKC